MRNLGKRIGLIHELRELARSEKLADGGHHRLGVHQVVRHGRRHLLVHRHFFLDGALHAHQADAELVLEQFAHRAHAAVAQMVDVVYGADAFAQLQQVADGGEEILGIQDLALQRAPAFVLRIAQPRFRRVLRIVVQLDVELHAPHAREIVLARIEEHAIEKLRGRVERRRIAGAQFAVDFDQRLVLRFDAVLPDGRGNHRTHVVALGEEYFEAVDSGLDELGDVGGGQLLVGVDHDLAGRHVDHIGGDESALQIIGRHLDLLDARLLNLLHERRRDLLALAHDGFAAFSRDGVRKLQADEAVVHHPVKLLILNADLVHAVERPQDLLVGLQTQGAQEHRSVELALAVDAHVKQVLDVVFKLHPASAIGDDLTQEVTLRRNALEEDTWRTVQLRNDDAFGAVDNERAIVGHQRNLAEEDLLLLDITHAFGASLGILGVNREADRDLERCGVRHAPLLALHHVVLQLQAHRVAALIAERDHVFVESAAMLAQHVARVERIGANGGAALRIAAGGAQVVQPFQVPALALPVADRVVHELQLAHAAKVRNREYRIEYRLQARVFPLVGKQVHLQEPLVRLFLNLDQVRNWNGCFDLRKIHSLRGGAIALIIHSLLLRTESA